MKSLAIYGNLIVDHVYCVDEFHIGVSNESKEYYSSIGAIGNMLAALDELSGELMPEIRVFTQVGNDPTGISVKRELFRSYGIDPSTIPASDEEPTSAAIILSELGSKRRSSVVKWGACSQMKLFPATDAGWAHFMYADTLLHLGSRHLSRIAKRSTISLDLCLSKQTEENRERLMQLLPYVDYLIISDDEAAGLYEMYPTDCVKAIVSRMHKNGTVIVHGPGGTIYSICGKGPVEFLAPEKNLEALDVLGAGDMYASAFILAKYMHYMNTEDAVAFAHKKTHKLLSQRLENA